VICVLSGGVGAARFLRGLQHATPPDEITAIVNTADDLRLHGLAISPDLDTCTYTLAEAIDPTRGWGLVDESWRVMGELARYRAAPPTGSTAAATWFGLGDRDLATHLYRTHRLAEGASLTDVTAEITRAWEIEVRLLPMSDDPVATRLTVTDDADGTTELAFQEYFVARRHDVPVTAIRFEGAAAAVPAPGVLDAIATAALVVIAPSNPIVSIGPLLAVPGIREAVVARRADTAAISPIVAGSALKGPADRMLTELGHEASVVGVARIYAPLAATLVIDRADEALESEVAEVGITPLVTDTVMATRDRAIALARAVLDTMRALDG
jgi:LPPG:FO 2-phospho-L-lactate transferase